MSQCHMNKDTISQLEVINNGITEANTYMDTLDDNMEEVEQEMNSMKDIIAQQSKLLISFINEKALDLTTGKLSRANSDYAERIMHSIEDVKSLLNNLNRVKEVIIIPDDSVNDPIDVDENVTVSDSNGTPNDDFDASNSIMLSDVPASPNENSVKTTEKIESKKQKSKKREYKPKKNE